MKYAWIALALMVAGCSTSRSTYTVEEPAVGYKVVKTTDAEGKLVKTETTEFKPVGHRKETTITASSELFTGHGTSADAKAQQANTKRQPKTAVEIDAESRAARNNTLFWIGIAGMVICGVGWGAKMASSAAFGTNMILNALASIPTIFLNGAGVIGGSFFAWSILPEIMQMGIAAVTIVAFVLTGYASWKSSHKGKSAIHKLKSHPPADP